MMDRLASSLGVKFSAGGLRQAHLAGDADGGTCAGLEEADAVDFGKGGSGGMGVQPPKVMERLRRAVAWVLLIWDENAVRPLTSNEVPDRSVL